MDSALRLHRASEAAETQDRLVEMWADSRAWRSSCESGKCRFNPDSIPCHFGPLTFLLGASIFSSVKWHC